MYVCASCGTQHTEGPVCSVCKRHYDYQCSGVTEAGYRKLGDRKNHWRCLKCKSSPSPSPIPTSPQPSQLDKIQEQVNKIVFQLSSLPTLVADVKAIKDELNCLKDSVEMAHHLINNFSEKVKNLEKRIVDVELVAGEVPSLRSEVGRLTQEMHIRDQWNRANNVEIRGIPYKKNENLYDIVEKIGSVSGQTVSKKDINYLARIPTRTPNVDKPIVVAFNCRYVKEEFIASTRKTKQFNLSHLGFSSMTNFYVNDHLTSANKLLLSKAKKLAKENNFQYIWVKHCKIMVKKSDTSPTFFIKCENDLSKITS